MRIARKYQHKVKQIEKYVEADSGLYQYSIELNLAYIHPAFGKKHTLNNPNELRKFMIEVIPVDSSIIDIACISTAKNFYEISIEQNAEIVYTNKAGQFREKKMSGEKLIRALLYSEVTEIFEHMHEDEICLVSVGDLHYVIHYFDISWWRSSLPRLERYFDVQPEQASIRKIDNYDWSSLRDSDCKEDSVKYDISVLTDAFTNVYKINKHAKRRTYEQFVEAIYSKLPEKHNSYGKANTIELIEKYISRHEGIEKYIERSY